MIPVCVWFVGCNIDEPCDDIVCGEVQSAETALSRYMYHIPKYPVSTRVTRFAKNDENV